MLTTVVRLADNGRFAAVWTAQDNPRSRTWPDRASLSAVAALRRTDCSIYPSGTGTICSSIHAVGNNAMTASGSQCCFEALNVNRRRTWPQEKRDRDNQGHQVAAQASLG
jgi:hypothetical protein